MSEPATEPARCDAWLAFTPRDTVIVRDGRSFDAGADSLAESVRPWPSTVAGATRAAYGAEPAEVRGPVLAHRDGREWVPYFPVPADLARTRGGRAVLLRPDRTLHRLGARSDLGDEVTCLLSPPHDVGRVEPFEDRWMPKGVLERYLSGVLVEDPADDIDSDALDLLRDEDEQPLVPEQRVGLARQDRTVREGYLYQATHLRPREGWAFLAGCVFPEEPDERWDVRAAGPVQLGGRGRLADVETVREAIWPSAPATFPDGRVLVYLATPAIWWPGWRPSPPDGAELTGAAVPAPQPVASASPYAARRSARGLAETVRLRWAVPAGAVYLLTFADAGRAAEWARRWHGRALPPAEEDLAGLADKDAEEVRRLSTAGFGVVLAGRWKERADEQER